MAGEFLCLYKSWLALSWHLVLYLFQRPQGEIIYLSIPPILYAYRVDFY